MIKIFDKFPYLFEANYLVTMNFKFTLKRISNISKHALSQEASQSKRWKWSSEKLNIKTEKKLLNRIHKKFQPSLPKLEKHSHVQMGYKLQILGETLGATLDLL